jgi:hypothetical protein
MILYDLTCPNQHSFEGWFSSSADFDRQSEARQVACPYCEDRGVIRAPMAPRIGRHARTPMAERPPHTPAAAPSAAAGELGRIVNEFCREVESNADYVGKEFPEEARKIHYGETTKRRTIYGEATIKDAVELKDEGIDVTPIPWVKKSDA